jgi:hypothetical protein
VTDERNDGAVPPPSEPAPPPLAAAPPPVAPPQPAPQPYPAPVYQPPAPGSGTGKWFLFIILAFAAGVGGTILVLWLTGDLWNSRSSAYSSPSFSSSTTTGTTGTTGTSSYGGTTPTAPAPPANSGLSGGSAPTPTSLVGTWGPNCPGSNNQAATFYSDGTMQADGDNGTWVLDGYTVTVRGPRETTILRWEMLGNDSAQVTREGGNSRVVNRCP